MIKASTRNSDILEIVYLLHDSAFHPHETNKSADRNRIFLKLVSRSLQSSLRRRPHESTMRVQKCPESLDGA